MDSKHASCETAKRVGVNAVKLRVFHYNDAQENFRRKFVPMYRGGRGGAKAVGNDPCFSQITEMRRQQYRRCLRSWLLLGRMGVIKTHN